MRSVDEILERAKRLPIKERRELVERLEDLDQTESEQPGEGPYDALLALAGTAHSDIPDLAENKCKHVADALWQHKQE
jgi:hypothetical protein